VSNRLGLTEAPLFDESFVAGELRWCEAEGLTNMAAFWREQRTWLRKHDNVPPSTRIRERSLPNVSNLRLARRQRYLVETAHTFAMEADGRRPLRDRAREWHLVEREMHYRGLPTWPHS
jgi:hypothetical protein